MKPLVSVLGLRIRFYLSCSLATMEVIIGLMALHPELQRSAMGSELVILSESTEHYASM